MGHKVEEWRDIPGYNGWYQISLWGDVRTFRRKGNPITSPIFRERLETPVLMKPYLRKGRYMCVKLTNTDGKSEEKGLARLMVATWVGEIPARAVVWPRDGDPTNVSLNNLAVSSASEWVKASPKANGFKNSGIRFPVLKIDQTLEIVDCYHSVRDAARKNPYSVMGILRYCNLKCASVIAGDGFIYAWDDDSWLRKTLKRAKRELDALGVRYNDPHTECYYDLTAAPDLELDPDILWNEAPACAGGVPFWNQPNFDRSVTA